MTATPSTPRVTICIPAWNAEKYIRASLESIVGQTYPNRRIIVSDNCSSDGTRAIVESFSGLGVEYSRTPRQLGGPGNFNRCIELAKTEYVAIYHADDIYDSRIVEREVAYLDNHQDAQLVMTLDWWIDERGTLCGSSQLPLALQRLGKTISFADLFPVLLRESNSFLRTPTAMLRRSGLGGLQWDVDRFPDAGDLDLWLRIAQRGAIGVIDERLASYRLHDEQWSRRVERTRTKSGMFFGVMDQYLANPAIRAMVSDVDLVAYQGRRYADTLFRALRLAAVGSVQDARRLLNDSPSPVSGRGGVGVHGYRLVASILSIAIRVRLAVLIARLILALEHQARQDRLKQRRVAAQRLRTRVP